jgi:hypothetical protein
LKLLCTETCEGVPLVQRLLAGTDVNVPSLEEPQVPAKTLSPLKLITIEKTIKKITIKFLTDMLFDLFNF